MNNDLAKFDPRKKSLDEVSRESNNWMFLKDMAKHNVYTLDISNNQVIMDFESVGHAQEAFEVLNDRLFGDV